MMMLSARLMGCYNDDTVLFGVIWKDFLFRQIMIRTHFPLPRFHSNKRLVPERCEPLEVTALFRPKISRDIPVLVSFLNKMTGRVTNLLFVLIVVLKIIFAPSNENCI